MTTLGPDRLKNDLLDPAGDRIIARGPVGGPAFDERTAFEIGSMSKVLAALILADMVAKGVRHSLSWRAPTAAIERQMQTLESVRKWTFDRHFRASLAWS